MSNILPASQVDILKSLEKDEEFENEFSGKFLEVCEIVAKKFVNFRIYSFYIPMLKYLAKLFYQMLY